MTETEGMPADQAIKEIEEERSLSAQEKGDDTRSYAKDMKTVTAAQIIHANRLVQAVRKLIELGDEVNFETMCAIFALCDGIKKNGDALMSEMKDILGELEPKLRERFIDAGISQIQVEGATVYPKRDLYPKLKEDASYDSQETGETEHGKKALVCALSEFPMTAHLVAPGYNATTLKSFMNKEFERDDEDDLPIIPDELKNVLEVNEKFSIRTRKATSKGSSSKK